MTTADLEYFKLSKPQRALHRVKTFFVNLPKKIAKGFRSLGENIVSAFRKIGEVLADIVNTFIKGDWKTRLSYLIMGFGSFARGQWGRGLLFFLFQTIFNVYMFFPNAQFSGVYYLSKLSTLGTIESAGILQARTLEWVAISSSNAAK